MCWRTGPGMLLNYFGTTYFLWRLCPALLESVRGRPSSQEAFGLENSRPVQGQAHLETAAPGGLVLRLNSLPHVHVQQRTSALLSIYLAQATM